MYAWSQGDPIPYRNQKTVGRVKGTTLHHLEVPSDRQSVRKGNLQRTTVVKMEEHLPEPAVEPVKHSLEQSNPQIIQPAGIIRHECAEMILNPTFPIHQMHKGFTDDSGVIDITHIQDKRRIS